MDKPVLVGRLKLVLHYIVANSKPRVM